MEYCDKYGQSDKPLLADIFQNVHNKFFEPDPSYFLSAPGLAWTECLKEAEVEMELLTDLDMLLMVEKDMRHVARFIDTQRLITHTWKIMLQTQKLSYLMYWDVKNVTHRQCHESWLWIV